MSACKVCGDTGETGTFGIYDCAACDVAETRHRIMMALMKMEAEEGRMHQHDLAWEAYKLGQHDLKQQQEKQG